MQQFSKKTLRNFFFGTPASDEREQVSSWFTAEGENPEFENELYVLWNELPESIDRASSRWKIQCKLPPKTKRFCPLVLK